MAARPGPGLRRPRRSTRPTRATTISAPRPSTTRTAASASDALARGDGGERPPLTAVDAEQADAAPRGDADEPPPPAPPRASLGERALAQIVIPIAMLALARRRLAGLRHVAEVPHYILPSPLRIARGASSPTGRSSARRCWSRCRPPSSRSPSRWSAASALAILMAQSRWIELALFPYAVILQVTPIVAIAPLILIYTATRSRRC